MNSDARASTLVVVVESSFISPKGLRACTCLPVRQTPRRGDRLFGPATAAKEEAAQFHG